MNIAEALTRLSVPECGTVSKASSQPVLHTWPGPSFMLEKLPGYERKTWDKSLSVKKSETIFFLKQGWHDNFSCVKKKKKSNTICLEIYYHCCYYLGLIENLYLRPLYIVFVYRGLSCYENLEVFTYFFVSSSDFQDVTQL